MTEKLQALLKREGYILDASKVAHPWCAECGAPVETIAFNTSEMKDNLRFGVRVRCHGKEEEHWLNLERAKLADRGAAYAQELIEGMVAFSVVNYRAAIEAELEDPDVVFGKGEDEG